MNKEIKITPPKGYEIDKENSTLDRIVFKPIELKRWIDTKAPISGYWIDRASQIVYCSLYSNDRTNYNVFATEKQAKSALAMARISQLMLNDPRYGSPITDEEWADSYIPKYFISRVDNRIHLGMIYNSYFFLAFNTIEQRDLFLKENEQLVRDYLMI